jgi:BMFP domain-containing protein YqiC
MAIFIHPHHSRQAETAMLNPRMFDEINAKISQVIADSPAKDIEKNVRALMSAAFVKMDLVTREEFDVQIELLQRTRAKLTELEQRIAELEQRKGA